MRSSRIEQMGRSLAVVLPVLATIAILGHETLMGAAAKVLVWSCVWLASLNLGFAASRTTLATLGPRLPVLRGAFLALLGSTALGVWVPGVRIGIEPSLVLASVMLLTVASWETLVVRRLQAPTRLLLVGPRRTCANVIVDLARGNGGRFELVGIVDDTDVRVDESQSLVLGATSELPEIVERVRPDLVALVPGSNRPEIFGHLLDSASAGFRVLELSQFYEYAFGRLPVRDLTRAWFMSVLHLYQQPYSRIAKRMTDLAGTLFLLVLAFPLWPVLVLLVRSSPGPVFVRQLRVGEHGRPFTMYKFRTMRVDAERPGEAVWASQNDPRVTRAGSLMRRFRLDELPQIWNVLIGDMSIVGPRPERPEFIDELAESVPFWSRRHLVKPGITGWAQINRGYTSDAEGSLDKLSYDLWYIRHRSLTVDFVICLRTLSAVLRGEYEARRSVGTTRPVETHGLADPADLDPLTLIGKTSSGQLGTERV